MKRKNIAVFFDGTGQDRSQKSPPEWSNVVLLHDATTFIEKGSSIQTRKYINGVGTRLGEAITGGGFGIDLDTRIEEAYEFIYQEVNNAIDDEYEPHLYLFGFSRGAYAARWLASMLEFAGVRTEGISTRKVMAAHREKDLKSIKKWQQLDLLIKDVPIDFLGVWDTVEASIDPSFGIVNVPQIVNRAFHALAIDEWRYTFNPTRFNPSEKVTEVWFPGCHTDVGGGYAERAIANESMWWMSEGAKEAGLKVDEEALTKSVGDRSHELAYHDELNNGAESKLWKSLNLAAGYPGRFFRTIAASDIVHNCVQQFAYAAPSGRLTIPESCVVWNGSSHDGQIGIA